MGGSWVSRHLSWTHQVQSTILLPTLSHVSKTGFDQTLYQLFTLFYYFQCNTPLIQLSLVEMRTKSTMSSFKPHLLPPASPHESPIQCGAHPLSNFLLQNLFMETDRNQSEGDEVADWWGGSGVINFFSSRKKSPKVSKWTASSEHLSHFISFPSF